MFRISALCLFVMAQLYPALAQESNPSWPAREGIAAQTAAVVRATREYRRAQEREIVNELVELLAIPNIASDAPDIRRDAEKLKAMLKQRGMQVEFFDTAPGRGPVIYAELLTPGAKRTVIFYAHYDGQPVDPAAWTDTKPFEPALRTDSIAAGGKLIPFPAAGAKFQDDWRIYARSVSDDKSPIVALLAALDALRAAKFAPAVNVKFLLDGEEEAGSPNLEKTVLAHRERLSGDVLITCDGPVHQSGRALVFYGNRGVVDANITVYGPVRPLHSGHYGNWAPNPAMELAQLLASMKDASGRVLIEGFYNDVTPLSAREKRAVDEMPVNDDELRNELQFGQAEGGGKKLVELLTLPSLNVRGLRSAYVGAQSQNVVPDKAEASLDLRLVKNIASQQQFDRLIAHIQKQGYFVVSGREPTPDERRQHPRVARVDSAGGYPAARTSMDLPVSQAVARIVHEAAGDVVLMPTLGGSAPMHIFERMNLPVIGVPIVNYDNSQHSHNENLRLGHFWRGIEIYAALMAALAW